MYKRRKPRKIEASFLFVFWVGLPHSSRLYYPLFFLIKLSYDTGLSVASTFCCGETEQKKLHTPTTVSTYIFGGGHKHSV